MTALHVEEDLSRLRRRVPVPDEFPTGRYVVVPRSSPGVFDLGPVDYQLVLWLPVDDSEWPGVDAALGAGEPAGVAAHQLDELLGPAGERTERAVPADVARALIPASTLDACARPGAPARELRLRGTSYASARFEAAGWRHGWALRVPGGLVVSLFSF